MKKILLFLVALVATLSMNAQTTEIYKGTTKVATYSGADVTVSFVEGPSGIRIKQGTTVDLTYFGSDYKVVSKELPPSTGTAKRTGNIDVNWVQLWKDGPKFAEYNIGADKATDYGYYLAWGGHFERDTVYNAGSADLSGSDDSAYDVWGEHWRMPTNTDFSNLMNNCTCTWKTNYNGTGVNGLLCTGKDDYSSNSIFLPVAGLWNKEQGVINWDYKQGWYWSSKKTSKEENARCMHIQESKNEVIDGPRVCGYFVRPIYVEDLVAVTSVSLNKTELKVGKGNTETLSAIFNPTNATNKKVLWTSSNETVATVDAYGKVTGVKLDGECVITATTEDGGKTATCTVKVVAPTTGYAKATIGGKDVDVKWIQLWENGPKFAEYNVGVTDSKKSSKGEYYEWTGGDIVQNNWGNKWRMPTGAELQALIKNCTPGWTNYGGPYGGWCLTFTGKSEDYKNNEIAFPATAYYVGTNIQSEGHLYYWSSTFQSSNVDALWGCHDYINQGIDETYQMESVGMGSGSDKAKLCVRAVLNEPK